VNPLSALYILDEMLQRLKFDTQSEDEIRACDWFDLIVGSGHGGYVLDNFTNLGHLNRRIRIIALLLGRLQMTTIQAIKAYNSLVPALPTGPTEEKEERETNRRRFLEAFEKILFDLGYTRDSSMRFGAGEGGSCKV
jgi:hypothetical protein